MNQRVIEQSASKAYGVGDASYRAAGELAGITRLVDDFYELMDRLPAAKAIRAMHPADLTESRKKLVCFLSGWLGGPKLYAQEYGPISIPGAHRQFPIGEAESEAWLLCMREAAARQPYEPAFRDYLLTQLRVPAERIRAACGR
ncbi:group II truncated hemoglobin [Marinobacter sp. X15-166B]|uniref:group II truncated hemoglobin n=1 Tax=Marinobacter sp. X15-166B TaxID=1897620 RepID=UPI00085BBF47|nr:group II truncated hemoglobin [Marinobacter sp. X15-166B]OEY67663.1 globin [Marinobacter sp. X15-166B]